MAAKKQNKYAEKWTENKMLQLGDELINWLNESDENIFYKEFLLKIPEYYPGLISYLCEKSDKFSNLIKKATEIQEIKLLKFGIEDRLNATMTIFCLKNNHGYKDRHDISSSDGSMSPNININVSDSKTKDEIDKLE